MKLAGQPVDPVAVASAPTRGPWIEIHPGAANGGKPSVGPHTGAVD